jgi:transcriptional antiterminator RfaH
MKEWYALRSKPRKEMLASALLTRAGLEVYLPQTQRRAQRGEAPISEPYFPGYLFGRLDPHCGDIRLASYTPGIRCVVSFGGEPHPVPEQVVITIREGLARQQGYPGLAPFRPGDRVRIVEGPLVGIEAIFDRELSAAGRVQVLVRLLERLCRAELQASQLRRIG